MGRTSRSDFNESWLIEMPMDIGKIGSGIYDTLKYSLNDFLSSGGQTEDLENGFKKAHDQQIVYYWHEAGEVIDIIMELSVLPQVLVVNGIGKRPLGCSIYASDLYEIVLKDSCKSIRSDSKLSDDGYMLWRRLLVNGHKISVYDLDNPSELQTVNTIDELAQFYKTADPKYTRWQYVLSESGPMLAETRSYFNTRRMRELSGLGTED